MVGLIWIIGTYAVLLIVEHVFGYGVALWLASVLLAACLGAMWAAGDKIAKQRARDANTDDPA